MLNMRAWIKNANGWLDVLYRIVVIGLIEEQSYKAALNIVLRQNNRDSSGM